MRALRVCAIVCFGLVAITGAFVAGPMFPLWAASCPGRILTVKTVNPNISSMDAALLTIALRQSDHGKCWRDMEVDLKRVMLQNTKEQD